MKVILYQTLKDRGNIDEIETNGPFQCKSSKAWLGIGYYFWETFIEFAHWWGEVACENSYVISKADAVIDTTCYDLYGNTNHLLEFHKISKELESKIINTATITVPNVIEFLKRKKVFNYKALRARAERATKASFSDHYRVKYIDSSHAF